VRLQTLGSLKLTDLWKDISLFCLLPPTACLSSAGSVQLCRIGARLGRASSPTLWRGEISPPTTHHKKILCLKAMHDDVVWDACDER
jgi:hypothetical protein